MTRTRADAAPTDRRRWIVVALLIALGLGLVAAALWQRYSPEARQQAQTRAVADAVLAEFARDLPKPFGQGLVLEHVGFEGTQLVFVIRSSTRRVADAVRDPQSLEAVRAAEQAQMVAFCRNDDLLYLLARGMVATRRFVDSKGDRFFDVSITGAECAKTLTPART
jgi:hypothetical protein